MPRLPRILGLRRFVRAREGATAVEFAIVAIPMLLLLFGMLELGLVLLVSTTLDTATDFATREIRTGQFQTTTNGQWQTFENRVCDNLTWLKSGCTANLQVHAQTFTQFADTQNIPALTTYNANNAPACWKVGNAGSIVLVRVYYSWTVFTPLLNAALVDGKAGPNTRLIQSTVVFRNEPYTGDPTEAAGCN